jgi:hypothetical protein
MMCDLFAYPRHWEATDRAIDGRFVIAPVIRGQICFNVPLVLYTDGGVECGKHLVAHSDRPVSHFLVFKVSEGRVRDFAFTFNFTHVSGEELASALCPALQHLLPELDGVVHDPQDTVTALTVLIRELCIHLPEEEVVQQLRERQQAGEDFPRLIHSPDQVPEAFATAVSISEHFRRRDEARVA